MIPSISMDFVENMDGLPRSCGVVELMNDDPASAGWLGGGRGTYSLSQNKVWDAGIAPDGVDDLIPCSIIYRWRGERCQRVAVMYRCRHCGKAGDHFAQAFLNGRPDSGRLIICAKCTDEEGYMESAYWSVCKIPF